MVFCDKQLWDLVRRIEPTPTQKNGAARSQNHLREVLNSGQMSTRIETSYLSGSYARDTAIHPLDDVDIIFIVDPSYWPKPFSLLFGSADYPAPRTILQSFARAIRYRYRVSSVYGQRRSVCLQLYHLNIDVVPAVRDLQHPELIRIPDIQANQWIVTSPVRHQEIATAVNKFQDSRFKPLVKLLKDSKRKSRKIRTAIVSIANDLRWAVRGKFPFRYLQEGLFYFFDFVAFISGHETRFKWTNKCGLALDWFSASVPDVAGLSGNIIAGIDNNRRKAFIKNAIASRNKMEESLKARALPTGCRRIAEALKMRSG